jgi:hypothetical protein
MPKESTHVKLDGGDARVYTADDFHGDLSWLDEIGVKTIGEFIDLCALA